MPDAAPAIAATPAAEAQLAPLRLVYWFGGLVGEKL